MSQRKTPPADLHKLFWRRHGEAMHEFGYAPAWRRMRRALLDC